MIYTTLQKERIVLEAKLSGISITAKKYKVTRQTISNWIKKYNITGKKGLQNIRKANPKKLDDNIVKEIIELKRKEERKTALEIKTELNLTCSLKTIYKILKQNKLKTKNVYIKRNIEDKEKISDFNIIIIEVEKLKISNQINSNYLYSAYDFSSNIAISAISKEKNISTTVTFLTYLFFRLKSILNKIEKKSIKIIFNKSFEFYSCFMDEDIILNLITNTFNQTIERVSFYDRKKYLKKISSRNEIISKIKKIKFNSIKKAQYILTAIQINLNTEKSLYHRSSLIFDIPILDKIVTRKLSLSNLNFKFWPLQSNRVADLSLYINYLLNLTKKSSNNLEIKYFTDLTLVLIDLNLRDKDKDITESINQLLTIALTYFDLLFFEISEKVLLTINDLIDSNTKVIGNCYDIKIITSKYIGTINSKRSNYDKAYKDYSKMNSISKLLNKTDSYYESMILIADLFFDQGKYSFAKKKYLEVYHLTLENRCFTLNTKVLSSLALVQMQMGNYFEAEITLLKVIKLCNEHNFMNLKFRAYNNLAIVYQNNDELDKSLKILIKLFWETKEVLDPNMRGSIYGNIAIILLKRKETARAVKFLNRNIIIFKKAKNYYSLGIVYSRLGGLFQDEYEKTVSFLNSAYYYFEKIKNIGNLSKSLLQKINFFLIHNKISNAKKSYNKLLLNLHEIENIDLKIEIKIIGFKIEIMSNLTHQNVACNDIIEGIKNIENILKDDLIKEDRRFRRVYNKNIIYHNIAEILDYIKSSNYKDKTEVLSKFDIEKYYH